VQKQGHTDDKQNKDENAADQWYHNNTFLPILFLICQGADDDAVAADAHHLDLVAHGYELPFRHYVEMGSVDVDDPRRPQYLQDTPRSADIMRIIVT